MFKRLASNCYHHRRIVVVAWILLIAGLFAAGSAVGTGFSTDFGAPPGSESEQAIEILEEGGFGQRAGQQAQIVFQAEQGIDDPAVHDAIESLLATIDNEIADASVVSPYSPEGSSHISPDRTIAYAEVNLSDRPDEEDMAAGERIEELGADTAVDGLRIEYGGDIFLGESGPSSEMLGLIGAVIVLLIAFGSVLAMALPIVIALFGVGSGTGLIEGATRFVSMPEFTIASAAMIGIGVGIDYALLVVTRYRNALQAGRTPEDAIVLAIDTAGRSVLFAGTTVVISLLGLIFMGVDMISGVAIASSLAVLMTMLASLTLLPALLGFAGHRIDSLGLPWRSSAGEGDRRSIWYRWSRVVQYHPWPTAVVGFVLLLALSAPVLSMRLGFGDAGSRPEADTTRQAYDLLSEAFGPGFNGPLIVAADLPGGEPDLAAISELAATLNETPGIAFASPPIVNETGDAAIIQIVPTTSPQDEATNDLVNRLRNEIVPGATEDTTAVVAVGGLTAAADDFSSLIAERMPLLFIAVLALSFLLLMAVFRSVLVPLKAVIMNLLSVGAAYGIVVAIFQWGIGASLLGIEKEGPIEAWVPMMMFAVVFGLSMDYEVFLLSRIREEYDRTGDNARAVADGLAATARVITAAAAIMVIVFGSFAFGSDRGLQLLGVGLASAIFLDATVVRLLLVPATMEILGDRNWWIPGWLNRILPVMHVEPSDALPAAAISRGPRPAPEHR